MADCAAGALLLERLAGPGDLVALGQRLRAATSSTALIASPEDTPGLPLPSTRAATKPLKRSSCSGPTTFETWISDLSGIISRVVAERT